MPNDADEIFDEEEEKEAFSAILWPFLVLGFKKGINQGILQGSGKTNPEDVFTAAVQEALKRKSFAHAAQAVGTTKEEIQGLIGKAISEGQSIQQLGKAIKDQFDVDSRVRSLRIARTELTDTINDGTVETIKREGYSQKEWSTVIDGRERETHAAADGQVVSIHDLFKVGTESCRYPGDENLSPGERIQCRCACLAAGLSDDRKHALGQRFLRVHGSLEQKMVLSLQREFARQRQRVLSHFPS